MARAPAACREQQQLWEGLRGQAHTQSSRPALAGVGTRRVLVVARRVAAHGVYHLTRRQLWLLQRLVALTQQEETKGANQKKN